VLNRGAVFNLVGSFLDRPSIFNFVVGDEESEFLVLDYSDFKKLTLRSESLNNVIEIVKVKYEKEPLKYDFGRMVFQNITELVRAQRLKAEFESLQSPGLRGALSREQSFYSMSPISPFGKNSEKGNRKDL
jgi:hypothetical protein